MYQGLKITFTQTSVYGQCSSCKASMRLNPLIKSLTKFSYGDIELVPNSLYIPWKILYLGTTDYAEGESEHTHIVLGFKYLTTKVSLVTLIYDHIVPFDPKNLNHFQGVMTTEELEEITGESTSNIVGKSISPLTRSKLVGFKTR